MNVLYTGRGHWKGIQVPDPIIYRYQGMDLETAGNWSKSVLIAGGLVKRTLVSRRRQKNVADKGAQL